MRKAGGGGGVPQHLPPWSTRAMYRACLLKGGHSIGSAYGKKRHLLKGRQWTEHNSNYYSPVLFYIHVLNQHVIYKPETHQIKEYWLRTTALTQQKDQGTWYLGTCASNPLQLCTAEKKHKINTWTVCMSTIIGPLCKEKKPWLPSDKWPFYN